MQTTWTLLVDTVRNNDDCCSDLIPFQHLVRSTNWLICIYLCPPTHPSSKLVLKISVGRYICFRHQYVLTKWKLWSLAIFPNWCMCKSVNKINKYLIPGYCGVSLTVVEAEKLTRKLNYLNAHQTCLINGYKSELAQLQQDLVKAKVKLDQQPANQHNEQLEIQHKMKVLEDALNSVRPLPQYHSITVYILIIILRYIYVSCYQRKYVMSIS